jgi:hypothetical protein
MQIVRTASLLLVGVILVVAAQVPVAQADDGHQVVVSIAPVSKAVAAPGSLVWTLRIMNVSSHALSGLRLAESVAVAGDPGRGGTAPFAPGGCGAALGTAYCPLPRLAPGQVVVRRGVANVPIRFAPRGPDLVGQRVDTYEQVVDAHARPVSEAVRLSIPITANSLPRTGARINTMVTSGLGFLLLGSIVVLGGRPRRRAHPTVRDMQVPLVDGSPASYPQAGTRACLGI